jgi:hypothetical protein
MATLGQFWDTSGDHLRAPKGSDSGAACAMIDWWEDAGIQYHLAIVKAHNDEGDIAVQSEVFIMAYYDDLHSELLSAFTDRRSDVDEHAYDAARKGIPTGQGLIEDAEQYLMVSA